MNKKHNVLKIVDKKLKVLSDDIPEPGKGEVLVKIKSFGVNRADILQVKGLYPTSNPISSVPGLEFSGEVCEYRTTSEKIFKGKRVCGLSRCGAYAEYIKIHEDCLIDLPDELSFEEGAAIPESWSTAYFNLFLKGSLLPKELVLVHSAAGGVGLSAVQLAKQHGARVIGIAGTTDKINLLQTLGVDDTLNYKSDSYSSLERLYENKIDVVLDTLGGDMLAFHCKVLAYGGRLLLIGLLRGVNSEINASVLLRKNISIIASTLRTQDLHTKKIIGSFINESVIPKIINGQFKVHMSRVFEFSEIEKAHEFILESKNTGNVVVRL